MARPLWAIKVLCWTCGHQGPRPQSQSCPLGTKEGREIPVTRDFVCNSSSRVPIH